MGQDKTRDTMKPLRWLLKVFGLNFNDRRNSEILACRILVKSIIFATILGSLNFYSLYYKMRYVYSDLNVSIILTDFIQTIFNYCQYIVDLYFVYKYGRDISLEYYKQYECIDKILDMVYYAPIKKRLVRLMGIFFLIWILSSALDFAAWLLSYTWKIPMAFAPVYIFLLIKILTTIDLISQIIQIECRLKVMGDVVQGYYNSAECVPAPRPLDGLLSDSVCNKNWFYSETSSRVLDLHVQPHHLKSFAHNDYHEIRWLSRTSSRVLDLHVQPHHLKSFAHNDYHEIRWLSRCYMLLREQSTFINNMYGIRILLNSLSLLIDMVRFANIGVRIIIGTQQTTYYSGYFPAVSSFVRMMTCAAVLISLVEHCEQTYRQGDRIISIIDHLLINKNANAELHSAMTELRALVQSRPINFTMANFISLNYSFLVSTASVLVTYTIILLQSIN